MIFLFRALVVIFKGSTLKFVSNEILLDDVIAYKAIEEHMK